MLKKLTKKFLTFKAGNFVFSCEYDAEIINPKIIEARVLYSLINELPVFPSKALSLKEELIKRSIFGTAAIEGNKLTEEEVAEVLEKELGPTADKSKREINNLKKIYELLIGVEEVGWKLDEAFIKKIHFELTHNLNYRHNSPGSYRNEAVYVGDAEHGGTYTPPRGLDDIRNLMHEFITWINSEGMLGVDSMIRACVAHYHLAKIHPFQDGNGRTARFIEAMILDKAGLRFLPQMMSNYYYQNLDDYFIAFSETNKTDSIEDVTPFLSFYFDGIISSLLEIKKRIVFDIKVIALRDFYDFSRKSRVITERQLNLLLITLETLREFTLDDLFFNPIFKSLYRDTSISTARRDLKTLLAKDFLEKNEATKSYRINYYVLG